MAGDGATPYYGTHGQVSRMNEIKIEMRCPAEHAAAIKKAVIAAHPFEEVTIEFFELVEV